MLHSSDEEKGAFAGKWEINGAGLLVLSAWCLGVLNSHRRFLLSYTAPVMWNAAMIATLLSIACTAARNVSARAARRYPRTEMASRSSAQTSASAFR